MIFQRRSNISVLLFTPFLSIELSLYLGFLDLGFSVETSRNRIYPIQAMVMICHMTHTIFSEEKKIRDTITGCVYRRFLPAENFFFFFSFLSDLTPQLPAWWFDFDELAWPTALCLSVCLSACLPPPGHPLTSQSLSPTLNFKPPSIARLHKTNEVFQITNRLSYKQQTMDFSPVTGLSHISLTYSGPLPVFNLLF